MYDLKVTSFRWNYFCPEWSSAMQWRTNTIEILILFTNYDIFSANAKAAPSYETNAPMRQAKYAKQETLVLYLNFRQDRGFTDAENAGIK